MKGRSRYVVMASFSTRDICIRVVWGCEGVSLNKNSYDAVCILKSYISFFNARVYRCFNHIRTMAHHVTARKERKSRGLDGCSNRTA